jgi:hypothetical protein
MSDNAKRAISLNNLRAITSFSGDVVTKKVLSSQKDQNFASFSYKNKVYLSWWEQQL